MMRGMHTNRAVWLVAAAAMLIVLIWQSVTVHFNYGGNWSGLYYIGNRWALPPALSTEQNLVFDNPGYDGGFYHLVAHDPWLTRGFSRFVDNPNLRWRRMLIPVLAHIVAFGSDQRIHACYIGVHLLFVFAGAFWLAGFCALFGLSPRWGFAFLAIPSVLVSIDRLTIDTALAALTIGFVYFACKGNYMRALVLLAFCPLARETGCLLTTGSAWESMSKREWRRTAFSLLSAFPFLLWCLFILSKSPHDGTQWLSLPLAGILRRTFHPLQYAITGRWVAAAAFLDYLALIGAWIALALVLRFALKRRSGLLERCSYVFAFAVIWLGKADIWDGAYEFGRTMSPLFILLGLLAVREKNRWLLLPLVCTLPRVILQYEPQIRGIVRCIL
jgi:hypothetical protein